MDYIVLSALIGFGLLRLVFSYDIVCQWSKNLGSRMLDYPEHMRIDLDHVEIQNAVPSFHIHAHGADCQQLFSFAFLLWVARTVGEEVETGWAHMNLVLPSIQEMAPGHCHEVLNDHWGGWNFHKIITFRK
jgi:Kyakuja-Dileera-Zisupton transposase